MGVRTFHIEVTTLGLSRGDVTLNGEHAGYAVLDYSLRAPRKWTARVGPDDGELIEGRFRSMDEAAFAVALEAHDRKLTASILASLDKAG